MKKKINLIVCAVLIFALAVGCVFLVAESEGNKLVLILQLVCAVAVTLICIKGFYTMMAQFDDENKRKLTWKQLVLFDAALVIIGIVLAISKMIEVYRGYGAAGARFHSYININVGVYYAVILIMAIVYTVKVFHEIFKTQYRYEKKTIEIDGNDISADIFVKANYKGEILSVEAESEINGKKFIANGIDEKEATENLRRMLEN